MRSHHVAAFLQVGFKNASDYETFVWVREKELPETNEVIEVISSFCCILQDNTVKGIKGRVFFLFF